MYSFFIYLPTVAFDTPHLSASSAYSIRGDPIPLCIYTTGAVFDPFTCGSLYTVLILQINKSVHFRIFPACHKLSYEMNRYEEKAYNFLTRCIVFKDTLYFAHPNRQYLTIFLCPTILYFRRCFSCSISIIEIICRLFLTRNHFMRSSTLHIHAPGYTVHVTRFTR